MGISKNKIKDFNPATYNAVYTPGVYLLDMSHIPKSFKKATNALIRELYPLFHLYMVHG